MDFFVARLMSLNEHELSCLRSDQELQGHLQRTHLLMESKLRQYSNASSMGALDLRLSDQQQQENCFNYNKMKFIEWTSNDSTDESPPTPSLSTASTTLARDDLASSLAASRMPLSMPTPTATATNHDHHSHNNPKSPSGALTLALPAAIGPSLMMTTTTTASNKKHKGEFDEPNVLEAELRLKLLMRDDNYHSQNLTRGECACILGSEFRDKTASAVLAMVEQWRQLPTEQRIAFKWDMNDLPKDIPLSDIKRFENLRREASSGRADFGGVSRRKPLGIRGTRQFLLILYCLWGHPGRDDPMQREGYCPHCFARIVKSNEQSILVRVVNHFNMKHKRGANPRHISPTNLAPKRSHQSNDHVDEASENNNNKTNTD